MSDTPSPTPTEIAWSTCVLVCRDCFERTDGPRCGGDAATAKARIKQALRDLKPAVRTMESSCMDCCPAGAFTVCVATPGSPPQGFALTSLEETDAIVQHVRRACGRQ